MAQCITCEEEYSDKRLELGYMTCLDCGQADAASVISARNRRVLAEIAPSAVSGELEVDEERNGWDEKNDSAEERSDESR